MPGHDLTQARGHFVKADRLMSEEKNKRPEAEFMNEQFRCDCWA